MLYPIKQLKIVHANTLTPGTFIKVTSIYGFAPTLAVVVNFGEPARRGLLYLEGQNAYSLEAGIEHISGYVYSKGEGLSLELVERVEGRDNYAAGQLTLIEGGAYLIGLAGHVKMRSNIFLDLSTWTLTTNTGQFGEATFFDQWSLVGTDQFGNRETLFEGQRLVPAE